MSERKEKWFIRLLKRIGLIKTNEISIAEYEKMCKGAINDGICPGDCGRCAWGRYK